MHHRPSFHYPFMFLASLFLDQGIEFSLGCALVGLLAAGVLIRMVLASSAGNEKMREIAGAVQAGARAYLNRQVRTIAAIAVVVMGLVFWAKGLPTTVGFVVGAVCSLAAGYIGMMVAVRANVRTTQAASVGAHPALKVAFNGGAVTGVLVVALVFLALRAPLVLRVPLAPRALRVLRVPRVPRDLLVLLVLLGLLGLRALLPELLKTHCRNLNLMIVQ